MLRFATLATCALIAAACMPPADEPAGTDAAEADAALVAPVESPPPPEALHALMRAEADSIIPSDWNTGEPAPRTYWHIPDLEGLEASSECLPLPEAEGLDCTLTLHAPEVEVNGEIEGGDTALYRMQVARADDGSLTLLNPNVRWAVMG